MSEGYIEREPFDPDKYFDPLKVSPSRVNKLAECGVAFEMYYLKREPPRVMGSYALFGNVVHAALEKWSLNRSQSLLTLMRDAWIKQTEDTPVKTFLQDYAQINVQVLKAERAARESFEANPRNKGKKCQAPRMTKHFKESQACAKMNVLLARWLPKLERESPWRFTERDPLPQFYDDSLVLAKRYEKQWKHLPPALHTEFSFDVPWRGFRLTGYIDAIELLINPESGELQGYGVIDYKTYKREPSEHKDYRQLVMYDVALKHLVERGAIVLPRPLEEMPVRIGIDYVRYAAVECDWLKPEGNSRRFWTIGEPDYDRLERELCAYRNTVEGRNFLPADKGQNADFCDYGELCCQRSCSAAGGSAERVEIAL